MSEDGNVTTNELDTFVGETGALSCYLVVDLVVGVAGVALNGISGVYYKSRIGTAGVNVNHLLYLILSVFGVAISCGALLHSLIFLFSILYTERALLALLPVSYTLMITSTYSSALISVMLAVIRTISIVYPVKKINQHLLLVCIGVYWVIWVGVAATDSYYWSNEATHDGGGNIQVHYYYSFINMAGLNGLINLLNEKGMLAEYIIRHHGILLPIIIWVLPCVVPSFICLVCTLIQITLFWKKRVPNSKSDVHSKVTVTIILLTAVFFVCNTVNFTVCMTMVHMDWKAGHKLWLSLYFATSVTAFLNALSNPLILITRGQQLRRYVVETVCRVPGRRDQLQQQQLGAGRTYLKLPTLFCTREEKVTASYAVVAAAGGEANGDVVKETPN